MPAPAREEHTIALYMKRSNVLKDSIDNLFVNNISTELTEINYNPTLQKKRKLHSVF